jgi:Fic family protein
MRLQLRLDRESKDLEFALDFLDRRSYVTRAMVPQGYEEFFREEARYISAHTSTAIEGNPLGQQQAMLVLVEGADADDPNAVELVNLRDAYELMAQLTSDASLQIDEGIIRTINSMVLKGLPGSQARNRGKYRPGPSMIVDSATREPRYVAPQAELVPELMAGFVGDVMAWRSELPGPLVAALAHFALISIHPFEDGNGRTARLVADMLLDLTDSSIGGMLSISGVLLDERRNYYQFLRETQGERFVAELDVTPFVTFHTKQLGQAAIRLEERAVRLRKRLDWFASNLKGMLNPRQAIALMFIMDIGPLSSSRYAEMTNASQSSAISDLNDLVRMDLAVRVGKGRATRYGLHPRVQTGNDPGLRVEC